ncbi:hypothetical protein E4U36_001324 [Claviceps purpurea]|nr:hypothetical protein E4U51_003889 [Claviceps purpurea]KAG6190982.1 hypothetical protein E4U36_001324 [Claviceps purpurea]
MTGERLFSQQPLMCWRVWPWKKGLKYAKIAESDGGATVAESHRQRFLILWW